MNVQWHLSAPPALHIIVGQAGCTSPVEEANFFAGDYILSVKEQAPWACRWELRVSEIFGLGQIVALCKLASVDGTFELSVYFEGSAIGPRWYCPALKDFKSPVVLRLQASKNESVAQVPLWPDHIVMSPLYTPLPGMGHHHSPQESK